MKKLKKLLLLFSIFSFYTLNGSFSEVPASIDFYGIASKDADRNMLSMTSDLYFTQLNEMNVTVSDRRSDSFSEVYFSDENAAFNLSSSESVLFAVIKKLPDSKWECTLNLRNLKTGSTKASSKIYDSYYKIMMESKTEISKIFSGLMTSDDEKNSSGSGKEKLTVESIAGTWTGENSINKIVILRAGRGFVIFKNGASMNISVKIENHEDGTETAEILQTSGNNASYFPEIDRKTSLELALNAKPVKWIFHSEGDGILSGTKETFEDNGSGPVWSTVKVQWKKSN